MTSLSALHNSPSSSITRQGSNQMTRHIYPFPIRMFVSRFHGLLIRSQAGANHVGWLTIPDYISGSDMCQMYLSGPQSCGKSASTSTPKNVGMKPSTASNGGAFYTHLAL